MRAAFYYFGISGVAFVTHLGAMIISYVAISGGAVEINPLSGFLGPLLFQALDFTLISGIAILVWLLPIPRWVKIADISLLASSTSVDFFRDLAIYISR